MFQCIASFMKLIKSVSNSLLKCTLVIIYLYSAVINTVTANAINSNVNSDQQIAYKINTIGGRIGGDVVIPCGVDVKELLENTQNGITLVPVLVNWFRHYSLTRKSERPIYAKYLAHLIDYEPHIEREYENRLQIVDHVNLNISNLKTTDEGIYECKLIFFDKAYSDNKNGSMNFLQIYVAPEFENLSDEITYLKANMPIRLYCYVRGKPVPSISWYKNGKKMDVTSPLLYETFHDNLDSDVIDYKCVAENIIDKIEYNMKVIKSGSLIFTEQLSNQTIVEGMLLNWPCLAQSNVDISYKWFKDSIAVQTYLRKWPDRGAVFQDGMLYLSETLRYDTGFYECHAYTQNKRIQTRAYLDVIFPPEIINFTSKVYGMEGSQMVVLECNTRANPAVHTFEWFKDDQLLSNNNKYFIDSGNGSLIIKHVKKSDHGVYYCTAENTLKKVNSTKLQLQILSNRKADSILYASLGQKMQKLPCKYTHLTTKWFKLGSKLPDNRHSIDKNGVLTLTNLNKQDSGIYLCIHEEPKENYGEKLIGFTQQKLIRLVIVENGTLKASETEMKNNKNLPAEAKNELPLAPENIRVNKTDASSSSNEVLITWSYPEQTKIKIEYYQLNYRHVNNKTKNQVTFSDWITIEQISVTDTSYALNTNDLVENEFYQVQMISYSIYSHSLPSDTVTFKYTVDEENKSNQEIEIRPLDMRAKLENQISSKTATLLKSVSQLDIILVTVFLFVIFIVSISVLAYIVYYRSKKLLKQQRNDSDNKDSDDWGFQSSSGGVTATFLTASSSPLSEKSLHSENKVSTTLNSHIMVEKLNNQCNNSPFKTMKILQNKEINMKNYQDLINYKDANKLKNCTNSLNSGGGGGISNMPSCNSSDNNSTSNSTTIISTNTNSTNLTKHTNHHHHLVLGKPAAVDQIDKSKTHSHVVHNGDDYEPDDNEYTNWLNRTTLMQQKDESNNVNCRKFMNNYNIHYKSTDSSSINFSSSSSNSIPQQLQQQQVILRQNFNINAIPNGCTNSTFNSLKKPLVQYPIVHSINEPLYQQTQLQQQQQQHKALTDTHEQQLQYQLQFVPRQDEYDLYKSLKYNSLKCDYV